jgi:hypothetical protein
MTLSWFKNVPDVWVGMGPHEILDLRRVVREWLRQNLKEEERWPQ